MGIIRIAVWVAAGTIALGTSAGTSRVSAQATDAARGAEVYTAQKCALCHSIAGKGNQRGALDDVGSRLSAEELRLWIVDATGMTEKTKATRKPIMRNYKLSEEDLAALVAYLQTLQAEQTP